MMISSLITSSNITGKKANSLFSKIIEYLIPENIQVVYEQTVTIKNNTKVPGCRRISAAVKGIQKDLLCHYHFLSAKIILIICLCYKKLLIFF